MTSSAPSSHSDDYHAVDHFLNARLHRWDCPSPQELGDYYVQQLEPDRTQHIAEHIGLCPACRDELAELAAFLAEPDAPTQPAQPTTPDSFQTRPPDPPDRARDRFPRPGELIARLLPQGASPALALRGDLAGPIIVEANGLTLFLELDTSDDDPALQGQIAAADITPWIGALVQAFRAGGLQTAATVDDLGGFQLMPFTSEQAELRIIAASGSSIRVPAVVFNPED